MTVTVGAISIRPMPGAQARARRRVLGRTFLVALLLGSIAFVAPHAFASQEASTVPADTWTVAEGETLWSIAAAITPSGESVRATLEEIEALNALESSALAVGDQLLIPQIG